MRTVACWHLLAWTGMGLGMEAYAAVLAGKHGSGSMAAVIQQGHASHAAAIPLQYIRAGQDSRVQLRLLLVSKIRSLWLNVPLGFC